MKRSMVAGILALCLAAVPLRAATLYVASSLVSTISQISSAGNVTLYSTLPAGSSPTGIAFDSSRNLYVAGIGTSEIYKVTPDGTATPFAALPPSSSPRGMAIDSAGNLYVAVINSGGKILQISPAGVVATTPFAALAGSLPTGLAFDSHGNLYAADFSTNKIQQISPSGVVTPFATLPDFSNPEGLTFDTAGNLYVAESNANQISKVTSSGNVSLFATLPGPPTAPKSSPEGIAFDPAGNLFVADNKSNQISEVSPDGLTVTTFATNVPVTFLTFGPSPPIPGDANSDGLVNLDDYLAIDNGFLNNLTGLSNGDFNSDGTVNGADYAIIDGQFETNPEAASPTLTTAIPEPASLCLLALCGLPLLRRRGARIIAAVENTPSR